MSRSHRTAAAATLLLLLGAVSATAQVELGAGSAVNSQYVWRGLTITNSLIVQPDVSLSFTRGATGVSLGGWWNVEPSLRTGDDDLSQTGGARTGIAEMDLWAEATRSLGPLGLTAGFIAYRYNAANGGINDAYNTDEVYAKVGWDAAPASPTLGVWFDVGKVHGAYLEGAVSHELSVLSNLSLTWVATAGYSLGQEQRDAADEFFNFAQRGLTHVDLGVSASFTLGALEISPALHVQLNQLNPDGQNTGITGASAANADRASKIWFGVRLGWAATFGERPDAAAQP
jgi:hypothetical protein